MQNQINYDNVEFTICKISYGMQLKTHLSNKIIQI